MSGRRWENWSGIVRAKPRELAQPRSMEELARVIGEYGRSGRRVRVAGSGHSFTPLVQTDDVLVSMAGLSGVSAVNEANGTVTVLGGTHLKLLGDELLKRGLAQENLGDIDVQTITGAISTGTHGTGIRFGTLSTQLAGITLVTASGDVLECSPEREPEVFKAAQVSLGALGVIAAVKLRVVPAERVHFQSRRERLSDCLENLERYKTENDHFEFFWFPYTHWTQVKFINETQAQARGNNAWGRVNDLVLENGVFGAVSMACRLVPSLCRTATRLSSLGISSVDKVDYTHRVYTTTRLVHFNEMEYNLPAAEVIAVLAEMDDTISRQKFAVNFPVEVRFVHSDDIWLSPAYQRESAYIAVHMYRGMPYERYFHAMEEIFTRHGGRPHWGKLHTRDAAYLAAAYPRWGDFQRVRASLDPNGTFLNDYLRELFGLAAPVGPSVGTISAPSAPTSPTDA
jgi:FAD-linked oxidoreductase